MFLLSYYHYRLRGSVKNKWELLYIRQTITSMGRFCLNIQIKNLHRYMMYISQSFKSFVRRLIGNGKGYQLRLRSRRHYLFSTECKNVHKGIFKTVKTVYEREYLGLCTEQVIGGFYGRLFGNGCHNHETSTKKRHFIESTKWLRTWLNPSGLFINEIFSLDGFHCNTYSLSHIHLVTY